MPFDFDDEASEANNKFAAEIARLTTLKVDDVQRLFPRKVDKQQLVDLMKIVRSSASRNSKAAQLQANFQNLGGAALKLLETLT